MYDLTLLSKLRQHQGHLAMGSLGCPLTLIFPVQSVITLWLTLNCVTISYWK